MPDAHSIFAEREQFSRTRLDDLAARITEAPQPHALGGFTIFCAGSYARHEASEHSDLDLFFLYAETPTAEAEPHTKELSLFGALIAIAEQLRFPKFSNDAEYLRTLDLPTIQGHLGSPDDDYSNSFTVRMLMLLESHCLYGTDAYESILKQIIASYYRDYPDHQATFQPWFLLNDIGRFWKTLLLNYENKRNQAEGLDQTKQKVRNFKLKFSRMTTCFATVAALGSAESPVSEEQVFQLIQKTPRERLQNVAEIRPETASEVGAVLDEYAWFLEQTAMSADALYGQFEDKTRRNELFTRANRYGDRMFDLLAAIDRGADGAPPTKFMRFLVI